MALGLLGQKSISPENESPVAEVVGCTDSGLVSFHIEALVVGKSFIISRNWLVLGRAVSPGSARL